MKKAFLHLFHQLTKYSYFCVWHYLLRIGKIDIVVMMQWAKITLPHSTAVQQCFRSFKVCWKEFNQKLNSSISNNMIHSIRHSNITISSFNFSSYASFYIWIKSYIVSCSENKESKNFLSLRCLNWYRFQFILKSYRFQDHRIHHKTRRICGCTIFFFMEQWI